MDGSIVPKWTSKTRMQCTNTTTLQTENSAKMTTIGNQDFGIWVVFEHPCSCIRVCVQQQNIFKHATYSAERTANQHYRHILHEKC